MLKLNSSHNEDGTGLTWYKTIPVAKSWIKESGQFLNLRYREMANNAPHAIMRPIIRTKAVQQP